MEKTLLKAKINSTGELGEINWHGLQQQQELGAGEGTLSFRQGPGFSGKNQQFVETR